MDHLPLSVGQLPRLHYDGIGKSLEHLPDGVLGSLPLSRRPLFIHEFDRIPISDAIK
jgi:hypothetical protein